MTSHRANIDQFNARSEAMRRDECELKIAILRHLRLNLKKARQVDEAMFGEGNER